jgi:hypothetical protein
MFAPINTVRLMTNTTQDPVIKPSAAARLAIHSNKCR